MLQVGSSLKGYIIESNDGEIGKVSDLLFNDRSWKLQWLVVDTGNWMTGRIVLIHPAAIGRADRVQRVLAVALTKSQIEASPDLSQHQPVSRQMEANIYGYYGWDPNWGSSFFGPGMMLPDVAEGNLGILSPAKDRDPHLCSLMTITGYNTQAVDGGIGHLENVLLEDAGWDIRYLIIDTVNWWLGQHVLISPYAVRRIDWLKQEIFLDLSKDRVKNSPFWEPVDLIDEACEKQLHHHYGWPGYGW